MPRYGRLNQPDPHQEVVDQSRITQNVDPAHGPDDEADPKRQHNQQEKSLLITAFAAVEKICGDISHDDAENDGLKGDANRPNENFWIEEILEEFSVIAKLEGGDVRSAGGSQPETLYNDKTNRNNQKQKNCAHGRRQPCPGFPRFLPHIFSQS